MSPCTKTMASKKFITWGFLFILMFLLASEAASRKVPGTSELGNSKVKKGGVVPSTTPNLGTHFGVGYGYDQSKKSSAQEVKKDRRTAPPSGPNPFPYIPDRPAVLGSPT
ncbi:hypothetical protein ACB092_12G026100 [Castanea dentata]